MRLPWDRPPFTFETCYFGVLTRGAGVCLMVARASLPAHRGTAMGPGGHGGPPHYGVQTLKARQHD